MVLSREDVSLTCHIQQTPTNKDIRAELREWKMRNQWQYGEIASAMRVWGLSYIPGTERLTAFAQSGMTSLPPDALRALRRFMRNFPQPGGYKMLVEQLMEERGEFLREKAAERTQAPLRREQERQAHQRFWLSREPKADGRPAPRVRASTSPLFGLDKATIHALSGGTL